jgi:hypothetical protein
MLQRASNTVRINLTMSRTTCLATVFTENHLLSGDDWQKPRTSGAFCRPKHMTTG